jgi:hypothetical protein
VSFCPDEPHDVELKRSGSDHGTITIRAESICHADVHPVAVGMRQNDPNPTPMRSVMKKVLKSCALAMTVAAGLGVLHGTTASAEETPAQRRAPQFSCSVNVSGSTPMVTITHTGGAAPNPTKDVFASIKTPDGTKSALVCGKALQADGSKTSVSFSAAVKKGFDYTCTAGEGTTTFACNPVQ